MPESQNTEWKRRWKDEYLEWICGYANAQGGKIYIGCDDSGKVIGVPNARKLLEDIPNKVRDAMGIIVGVNLMNESGKEYIEIDVPPYPIGISCKGIYYYRSGSSRQILTGPALEAFLMRKSGAVWDNLPLPAFSPDDADGEAAFDEWPLSDQSGVPIQISVYEDKLYIANCGCLPESWTLENLMGKHASSPYNPNIAHVFYLAGFIESWGRGIEKIKFTAPEERIVRVTEKVTDKEQELLTLLAEDPGYTMPQLAARLRISGKTVAARLKN